METCALWWRRACRLHVAMDLIGFTEGIWLQAQISTGIGSSLRDVITYREGVFVPRGSAVQAALSEKDWHGIDKR